ncbi:MAG: GDP-mannose 4,6-dehydratase [Rhodobacteraceae bacterium]|nr:GDP-mannose 4,6-dehydratase [Paracoccaceae bacterium]
MKLIVTGGAGFIGNRVMRHALALGHGVVGVDAISYAASLSAIWDLDEDPNYALEPCDIRDRGALERVFALHRPDAVIHLAAETGPDRALVESVEHVGMNIAGTHALLEVATAHWREIGALEAFRFVHVSTAEVFGALPGEAVFGDETPLRPIHPNAATKATAEHLVNAWGKTFGLPVITTHGCATYGPWQNPEKPIPAILAQAITNQPIGAGGMLRDWIHVDDHARAILRVLEAGRVGESYNISAGAELGGSDLARVLCRLLQVHRPAPLAYARLIEQTSEVAAKRSALDATKLREDLGWQPQVELSAGLARTVEWYCQNHGWWLPLFTQTKDRGVSGAALSQLTRNVA